MKVNKEINFDKLLTGDCKITLANYEMENGEIVTFINEIEIPYDDEKIYLLKIKPIENIPLYKIIEEGM
jgi:hypothetical protein